MAILGEDVGLSGRNPLEIRAKLGDGRFGNHPRLLALAAYIA